METKLFVAGLVLSAANAFGAVYYVATDANDNNAGSQAKPFATLKKCVQHPLTDRGLETFLKDWEKVQ